MKLKMLLLFAASVSSVIVLACSEVVFPTPLPTATPAPTATPIVFPTPLPTATPFSIPSPLHTATPSAIIFPTPLPTATPAPTATPVSIPSPLPTATPSALVLPTPLPTATPAPTAAVEFPTPLPTATPAPTATPVSFPSAAFANIGDVKVVQLHHAAEDGDKYGVGFAFQSSHRDCLGRYVCLLTVEHGVVESVVDARMRKTFRARVKGFGWRVFLPKDEPIIRHNDDDLDVAVVRQWRESVPGVSVLELAPPGTKIEVNDPVRVVAIDTHLGPGLHQWSLDGVVSGISRDGARFMLTAETFDGNSGSVVLNTDMQVIGMIVGGYDRPPTKRGVVVRASDRSQAVHVDAIRQKLREWGYLP